MIAVPAVEWASGKVNVSPGELLVVLCLTQRNEVCCPHSFLLAVTDV